MGNTLVFPSSVPAARGDAIAARERSERIIAPSSLACDESATHVEHLVYRPVVCGYDFPRRLNELVDTDDIGAAHGG